MWDHSVHSHKNWVITLGVPPDAGKTCFVFLPPVQYGLSDAYPAPI